MVLGGSLIERDEAFALIGMAHGVVDGFNIESLVTQEIAFGDGKKSVSSGQ